MLINDICCLFNIVPLRYISYTTGSYGVKKSQGITLQFSNLQSGEDAYIIYNANLKRTRKSKHAKKGDLLPGKQFIVSERSGFYKFWLSTGLPLPKSPSKFYECIGKLKPLVFISSIDFNNRITDKKLPLLELSFHEILNKHRVALAGKQNEELTAKQPLIFRQETAKQPLIFPAKDIEQKLTHNGLAANQSTCTSKCGNTVIRKEVLSTGVGLDNTPIDSVNNKEVASNINEVNLQKTRPEDQTVDEWLEDWESAFTPEEFDEVMADFSK